MATVDSPIKWGEVGGSGAQVPDTDVQGTLSSNRGRQGAGEHPGEVSGGARPLRGGGPRRGAGRGVSRGVSACGMGAGGGQTEGAVAVQQPGPWDQPTRRD